MLYIDCGHTAAGTSYTGIQRWVRHTLRQAHALGGGQVAALAAGPQGWRTLPQLGTHPLEGLAPLALPASPPRFGDDTLVLLPDRFWHTQAWDALEALIASPARIAVVVYDLLSLRHPGWFAEGTGERFGRYLRRVLPRAERAICLSATVAADLAQWLRAEGLPALPVSVVAPGHQVWAGAPQPPAWLPAAWREGTRPFVLQVGTLEPRKGHAATLAAVQAQWQRGRALGCLFIGQRGWLLDDFASALHALPQWQRELLWVSECTDAQLAWCYANARAVLYPSSGEGYGLPLAEAAAAGAAVIASDTPVHREVAAQLGGRAVQLCEPSPAAMGKALDAVLHAAPAARGAPARGWRTATAELLQALQPGRALQSSGLLSF